MRNLGGISIILMTFILVGCTATRVRSYPAVGEDKVCSNHLGRVVVLPEVAWRLDQKEPQTREAMALDTIKSVFATLPCGSLPESGGVRDFAEWSSIPESKLLKRLALEGVDTVIIIRIEELGPRLDITFSLPFLWSGFNEADFRMRVLATKTGVVLNDIHINRMTGGVFNVRPAQWSGAELNAALSTLVNKQ